MKIGIISDSHGDYAAVEKAVQKAGPVDLWLHAGDCCPDAEYLQLITQKKLVHVAGNCDWPGSSVLLDEVIAASGHKLWLTHGHLYGVNFGLENLAQEASVRGCDIAVYGHTHIAVQQRIADTLVLNPGSIARPRGGGPASFMVLALENNKVSVNLIKLI